MPRPPLSLGTYGKIKTWQEGKTWLARVKFRDFDGIVRFVKRSGKTKAAAERELKAALAERQMPAWIFHWGDGPVPLVTALSF